MPQFYSFPGSCVVQVLAGFGGSPDGLPTEKLDQKHRLVMAVTREAHKTLSEALKKIGFKQIGTFNCAHNNNLRMVLWVCGAEFKLQQEDSSDISKEKK